MFDIVVVSIVTHWTSCTGNLRRHSIASRYVFIQFTTVCYIVRTYILYTYV